MSKLYLRIAIFLFSLLVGTTIAPAATGPFALLHSLFDPSTNLHGGSEQGYSVALDGNLVVAGAPGDSANAGAVKVYDAKTWELLHTLTKPTPTRILHFGNAVAISGTRLVVGADEEDTGGVHGGSAYIYDLAGATPTVPWLRLTNPSPAAYPQRFGNSVAISGARVVIGAPGDITGKILYPGTAHVYDISSATPTVPTITLTNSAPGSNDLFGTSVAISGTRVVVGSPYDNTQAFHSGNVCVYDLASLTPAVSVATLNNPTPAMYDNFGISVAISGARVIVGASADNTGANAAGSAYVYDLASTTPTMPIETLNNPSPSALDYFGLAVAVSGTYVMIGAKNDDTDAVNSGRAYVYDLASASPAIPVITLTNPSPESDDYFGFAVTISNGRMVVGAPRDDTAGSAYVYDLANATPTVPIAALNQPSPAAVDHFGKALAVSGTRIVVGAPNEDTGRTDAGSVYVYDLGNSTPAVPLITLPNPNPGRELFNGDEFGSAVAISGTRVVVGAYYSGSSSVGSGRTYIYDLASTQPTTPVTTLYRLEKGFGIAVGISGPRVAVGSYNPLGSNPESKVYVYDLTHATPTVPVVTLTNPSPTLNNSFGSCVAISGTRMVVGAHWGRRAYVYDLASATPATPLFSLAKPGPALSDYFGYAVSIAGRHVVVGAPYDALGANLAGTAWVYDLASATPTVPMLVLTNPSPAEADQFGHAVAISDRHVAIGVPGDDATGGYSGSTYIYDLTGSTPAVPVAMLRKPNPGESEGFGFGVAIDGTTIVAGTPYDDTVATDRGAVFIFGLQPVLSIAPEAPGLATLWWTPVTSSGFALQYADSLAPTNWLNAPSGETNPVTLSLTNGAQFYRLRGP